MKVFIEHDRQPVETQAAEFVESKGIGHPDSICDSVCESCGKALAGYYKRRFGEVLHYNIDKALLIAGSSIPAFGSGKITSPARLIIAGRVTDKVGRETLPVRKVISDTAKKYLSQFRLAKFEVVVDVKSAAANLSTVSKHATPIANDTSFGASHYPLSRTEKLVLDVQQYLSSPAFRRIFPAAGQDVKVMGVRLADNIELTVAIAFVGKHVKDMGRYIALKNRIVSHLTGRFRVKIDVNTLDDVTGDAGSIYLTVSGLSAEMGDDGEVGRGNRFNGLITPNRPMSIEALAGKNSRHPGRCYQQAAYFIAKELVERQKAGSAEVKLVTDIGAPLHEPKAVHVISANGISNKPAEAIIRKNIKKAINPSSSA